MSDYPTISGPAAAHSFQVDLRGVVDLLSHHLYSSPRVYVRELLQNAVDAITARRVEEPGARAAVRIVATGREVRVTDSGIGLTEAEVHRFLATIGRSSKRADAEPAGAATGPGDAASGTDGVGGADGVPDRKAAATGAPAESPVLRTPTTAEAERLIGGARSEFLGQFGIGLLACFVVADEITVVTRSAVDDDAPAVEWCGRADGSYRIRLLAAGERPAESGTTVVLRPRPGMDSWFQATRVVELARDYGSLLPYETVLEDEAGYTYRITATPAPWERDYASPGARYEALAAYCSDTLGFHPLDVVELDIPLVGVRGAAFILPAAGSPAQHSGHRVHLKGMLLSDSARGLLPEWAFFVRCVIDTDSLRPTASREALYEDELLQTVREALGQRIRDWLAALAAQEPARLERLLAVHYLAVKDLARFDDQLFALVLPWLPFETTAGRASLAEFAREHTVLHLAGSAEEFQQVAPIAAAAGLAVVNGGYVYDAELVRKLPQVMTGVTVLDLDVDTVAAHLDPVGGAEELAAGPLLAVARRTLDPLDCDVRLRAFSPLTVPALLLDGREARHERARADAEREATESDDDLWAGILGALRSTGPRAQLVLNHLSPLVRGLISLRDAELAATGIEAVYGQALLMSRRPIRATETALLNRAFLSLLEHAVGRGEGAEGIQHPEAGE